MITSQMEKRDNKQGQIRNETRGREILRKNKKEMLEITSEHPFHFINHLKWDRSQCFQLNHHILFLGSSDIKF